MSGLAAGARAGADAETGEAPFLAACRRHPVARTPVWIMRQAGRYLPEYRQLRERHDFPTLCKTPELAAEVTLLPTRRFDLDAAILFSDIMTPLEGMGVDLRFDPGPVIASPIRSADAVAGLRSSVPEEDVPFVFEAIRLARAALPATVPLIGFAGAPFTLFCYLVEGGGSKDFMIARSFLQSEPAAAQRLLSKLADLTRDYLAAQAAAGAQALMMFDSWVGLLSPHDFRRFARPAVARALDGLETGERPLIYFPNQGATLLPDVARLNVDMVGVDWRVSLAAARRTLGVGKAIQGNLDPAALFASPGELRLAIDRVLEDAGPEPGFVFNLGHGIDRRTDPEAVALLVERVHAHRWS